MSDSFYIPIHSMNLAHYLGAGIITPSIYIENKNADIQDRFKNSLLLSSSKYTKETNCAIEVVFDIQELPQKISRNFYLFDTPLPISRIKSIYFITEEQKIRTKQNISYGDAFIPEQLLKISKEESIDIKELENVIYISSEKNWTDFLKRYDQILGGFSTMQISKESPQNYPTHYFSTLGNINNLFSNILKQQNVEIENNYQFAFNNELKFKDFYHTIYSDIDNNEIERYAIKDKVRLEVKNGIFQIDKIPENKQTYLVAILGSYGEGKRKQVDSFISDLISGKFSESKKEGLSLIFGLNKGYKAFRNKYKTQNFEIYIKFQLDSKLDYYIIESIYQNVFFSLNSISSFKYIDNWIADHKKEEIKSSKYVTYEMIDKTIVLEERIPTPFEKVLERISDIISNWFPFRVKKNEIESLFEADISQFKKSIESAYATQLEKSKILIEKLNFEIFEKDKLIAKLENQLNEKAQLVKEPPLNLKTYKNSEVPVNLVKEEVGSLFTYDNYNIKREQLEKMSKTALQKKARELKIPRYTKYDNTKLIDEILKSLPHL